MVAMVLKACTPDDVHALISGFAKRYVADWREWEEACGTCGPAGAVAKFGQILRRWQATRPLPMRRPLGEATHEPPHLEDLIARATGYLAELGPTAMRELHTMTPAQTQALRGVVVGVLGVDV
jgi:hypothetical protein